MDEFDLPFGVMDFRSVWTELSEPMHVVGGVTLTHHEEQSRPQDPPPPEQQMNNARISDSCKNVIISFF